MEKFFNAYIVAGIERIKKERKKESKNFVSLIEEPAEEEVVSNEMLDYLDESNINLISKQYASMYEARNRNNFRLTTSSRINNLYKKYMETDIINKKKLDQLVFDLKKKQLYSTLYEDMKIKKVITNGRILNELQIFVKKQKKNMTVYGFNIKKMFHDIENKEYIIEIVGCKSQIFKVIKYIKKYHKRNCVFVFTPRRSFFKNQFKKISSIKRKMMKRYMKSLYL